LKGVKGKDNEDNWLKKGKRKRRKTNLRSHCIPKLVQSSAAVILRWYFTQSDRPRKHKLSKNRIMGRWVTLINVIIYNFT